MRSHASVMRTGTTQTAGGRRSLGLPPPRRLEDLAEPKATLHQLLVEASGTTGRRRRKFPTQERVYRLADLIEDYSPLRALLAFRELEEDLRDMLRVSGWIPIPS
jgi:hypothetical protein